MPDIILHHFDASPFAEKVHAAKALLVCATDLLALTTLRPPGEFGADIAVGDFNSDGRQDLVVTNTHTDDVSLLLGNGDGTFQGAVSLAVGLEPRSVAVADFDGDGDNDLVTGFPQPPAQAMLACGFNLQMPGAILHGLLNPFFQHPGIETVTVF